MSKQIISWNNNPLIFNTFPLVYEIPVPPLLGFLNFYTNASTDTFDPTFFTSAGLLNWNLGDGSTVDASNYFSHTYSQLGNKYVQIFNGTTAGSLSITSLDMNSDNLVGTLDISSFSNLGMGNFSLNLNDNPKLTKIIFPISSQPLQTLNIYNCDITGVLDISGLTNFNGSFNAQFNPHLTQILNPSTNGNVSMYWTSLCDLTGTLDMRPCSSLGGSFIAYSNPHLTQILNPVNSKTFSYYWAPLCDLTETLDVSGLTGLGGTFDVDGNINLTKILNPISSQIFSTYYAYNCNLTGTLDVSGLTGLGGNFLVFNNPNLTKVLNPVSSQAFVFYAVSGCNLTGTLDVSGLIGLGGDFRAQSNPNLQFILNPSTNKVFSSYWASNCNLTGTLDLRSFKNLGGFVEISNNSNLTQILTRDSSQIFYEFLVNDCSLNGTLDVSGLTNLSSWLYIQNNVNLQNLILPTTLNRQFTIFNAKNCSLNTASIDAALLKLHNLYDASAPVANLIGNFDGTGNAWPTDGSSNVDYLGIYSAFAAIGRTVDISINYPPTEISGEFLNFYTNQSGNAFSPTFTVSAGTLNWDLGDSSNNVNANSFTHIYADGTKHVKVFPGTTSGALAITEIDMNNDKLVGTLDISSLSNLGGNFVVRNNLDLTQILNPVSSRAFTYYYAYSCNLTGTLDVSGLTGLGGVFNVVTNPSLNYILNPVSSQVFSQYYAYNCNLIGTLDVSGLTGLGGYFKAYSNPNLTHILNPVSSQVFSNYLAYSCNLTGTLDVSGLTELSGSFAANNNSNLTQILNPISSGEFYSYQAYNCNLTGTLDVSGLTGLGGDFNITNNSNLTGLILPTTLVKRFTVFNVKNCSLNITSIDAALLKLHTMYDANAPIANLIGNFDGSGNSWPTDGSSNVNYLGIYSAFAAAGKTVDISINYPQPIVSGVFDFDPSSHILLHPGDNQDILGNRIITWNMWLDQDSGYGSYIEIFNFISSITSDCLAVYLNNNTIFIGVKLTATQVCKSYSITGFANQILTCEIIKGTSSIVSFKINGVTQTSIGDVGFGGNTNAWYVGFGIPGFSNGTLWDIKVFDASTLINQFLGYPSGNVSSSWTRVEGGTAAVLTNPNGRGTRDIF